MIAIKGQTVQPLAARDYSTQRCTFPANPTGPVLRILDAIYMEDLDPVSTWCSVPDLARHYGVAEVRSVHRDHLDLRELYEARYHLLLAKPELVNSSRRAGTDGIDYELIAHYPEYGSQLVSLQGTPQLTAAWMTGKTLGLIDDPNSVSAYQIPLAALRRSGLEDTLKIQYFRSHRQLYQALFEKRVDIIPALLSNEDPTSALQLPPGLVLEETIAGPAWFIHRELLEKPQHCELVAALEQLADRSPVSYFHDLTVVRPCHAN